MYGGTLPIPGFGRGPLTEPGRKEAIAMAKKRPIEPKDFYLGPIPFNTQFPAAVQVPCKWLTDYWPPKRQALRQAILAEALHRL